MTQKKKKAPLSLIISLLVSAFLLWFVFKDVQWAELKGQMYRIRWAYVPVLVAVVALSYYTRALRWRYLLPNRSRYSTRKLFEATWLGNVATFILPLRAGEIVRPWLLNRWEGVGFFTALASVLTERVFDVLAIMILLAVSLTQIESVPSSVHAGAKALGFFAIVAAGGMLATYLYGDRLKKLFDWLILSRLRPSHPQIAERLDEMADEVINGIRAISNIGELILMVLYSLGQWVIQASVFYVGFAAFGEEPSMVASALVTVCVALAIAAPSAPGFLGTFQFGVGVALTGIYKFSPEFSLAFSLLTHAVTALTVIIYGAVLMNKTGLSLGDLKSGGAEASEKSHQHHPKQADAA